MHIQTPTRIIIAFALITLSTGCVGTSPSQSVASAAAAQEAVWSDTPMAAGRSHFMFDGWAGPDLPVWAFVPEGTNHATAPIMVLMHGAKRDPRRYLEEWIDEAEQGNFIIVAPEFAKADFPNSRFYNRGGLFVESGAPITNEANWAFSAIEPLFDSVVAQLGSQQTHYTLYGHSAGSQFVHRLMFLKPEARVKRFLPANAGWYTFPDLDLDYPYGLAGVPVSEEILREALAQDVVLLLGDQDNNTEHSSLNRSDLAMEQGPHRFARGQRFHEAAQALASEKGWEFNWTVRIIPGVAHSNGGIAAGAFDLVE